MNNRIGAATIALTLALGSVALAGPAFADDEIPAPVDVLVETPAELVADTPAEALVIVEQAKEPDVGYGLALWRAIDDGGDPWWPQALVSYAAQAEPNLNGFDELAVCGNYQADLYRDDDTTVALVAGGVLTSPGNPTESWPGDGYQSSYSKQWTETEGCGPTYVAPDECDTYVTLPIATAENPRGWGDTKGGTWTKNGLQLTAGAEEAYAYLDLVGADQFLLSSTLHGLDTFYDTATATGTFGVIIHTDKANVHYDADGRYWTTTAGVFPETSPGFYSTYDLAELLQDATIDSVAVWVNPGGSLLLTGQEYNCMVQPFGAEPAVVVPPVDLSTVPVLDQLALTGDAAPWFYWAGGVLFILLGVVGVTARKLTPRYFRK